MRGKSLLQKGIALGRGLADKAEFKHRLVRDADNTRTGRAQRNALSNLRKPINNRKPWGGKNKMFDTDISNKRNAQDYAIGSERNKLTRRGQDIDKQVAERGQNIQAATSLFGSLFNSPEWYFKDPELARSISQISTAFPAGVPKEMGTVYSVSLPCIVSFKYTPWIGSDTDYSGIASEDLAARVSSKPINYIIRKAYAGVRAVVKRNLSWTPADLTRYVETLASIVTLLGEAKRVYAIINTYSALNRSFSNDLISTLGWTTAITKTPSELLYNINKYVNIVKSFVIPSDLTLFQRRKWLSENIFTDSPDNIKSPLISFRAAGYYVWNNYVDDNTNTILKYKPALSTWNLNVWCSAMDELTNALLSSQNVLQMQSDLITAYGDGSTLPIEFLPGDATIAANSSQEFLGQIRNALIHNFYNSGTSMPELDVHEVENGTIVVGNATVAEDGNVLRWTVTAPKFRVSRTGTGKVGKSIPEIGTWLCDTITTNSSLEEIMINTRFMALPAKFNYDEVDTFTYVIGTAGSEILTECVISHTVRGTDGSVTLNSTPVNYWAAAIPADDTNYYCLGSRPTTDRIAKMACLHNMPRLYGFTVGADGTATDGKLAFAGALGDINNTWPISYDVIDKLHYIALSGEYHMPILLGNRS